MSTLCSGAWNPLDSLLIHPESYGLAARILEAESLGADQVGTPDLVRHFGRLRGSAAAAALAARLGGGDDVDTVALILEAFSREPRHDIRCRQPRDCSVCPTNN